MQSGKILLLFTLKTIFQNTYTNGAKRIERRNDHHLSIFLKAFGITNNFMGGSGSDPDAPDLSGDVQISHFISRSTVTASISPDFVVAPCKQSTKLLVVTHRLLVYGLCSRQIIVGIWLVAIQILLQYPNHLAVRRIDSFLHHSWTHTDPQILILFLLREFTFLQMTFHTASPKMTGPDENYFLEGLLCIKCMNNIV